MDNNVDSSWMFSVLLFLIIGPFVFYIVSLFIAWVKWIFIKKKELNASFAEIKDLKHPLSETITLKYKIGLDSDIKMSILDYNFKDVKTLIQKKVNSGNHKLELNTKSFANGMYFLELTTGNQKISKLIVIEN